RRWRAEGLRAGPAAPGGGRSCGPRRNRSSVRVMSGTPRRRILTEGTGIVKLRHAAQGRSTAVAEVSLRLRYSTRATPEEIRGKKGSTSLSCEASSRVAFGGSEALLSRTSDRAFNWPAIQAASVSEVTSHEGGRGVPCFDSSSSRKQLVTSSG